MASFVRYLLYRTKRTLADPSCSKLVSNHKAPKKAMEIKKMRSLKDVVSNALSGKQYNSSFDVNSHATAHADAQSTEH